MLEARSYEYDAHGRVSRVVDLRNGAMVYGYNALDQLVSVTTPAPGIGQAAQTVGLAYDGWGRRWVTTLADGTRTTNEYYATGELKQQAGSRTYPAGYGYDSQGRLRFMTNWTAFSSAGARVTEWQYEALRGWLTKKIHPGETDNTADYEYTYAGRLWKRHGERGVDTIYTHNAAGDLQTIDYSDSTPDVTLGYDRRGRLRTVARNGMTTTLAYNEVNELTSESHSGGTLNGLAVTRGYDTLGRRNSVSLNTQAPGINYSFGYDNASRLQSVTNGSSTATYSYVANSPLVSQIVFQDNGATRMTTAKQYDKLNRLQSISSTPTGAGQMPLGFRQGYDAANQRNRVNLPDGSYWVYEYDALGQVKAGKKHFADNTLVPGQQFEYTHDDIGNRTATKAGGDQYGQNLRSAAYTADALNLYTSRGVPNAVDVLGIAINTNAVTVNGAAAQYRKGEYFRHELTVNNASNPVWQSVTVSSGGSNAVGNVFVPKTPEGFAYDSDGNLMADGRWYYTWDGENRLVQVEYLGSAPAGSKRRLVFEYDGMGRRIRKTVTNVDTGAVTLDNKFMYEGWNLMAELNATNNNVIRSYTWGLDLSGSLQGAGGIGGLLMVNDAGQGLHFAANDSNGNVAGLVNAGNGSISARYEYGAFGELIRATGPMGRVNPFRFSTKYYDEETDLVAYPYRYYSPGLGRWLNRDYLEELGGLNLFGFVGNDPVRFVDPMGLDIYSSDSLFYPSGPLPYLTGDTMLESLAAGFFNGIPFVGNAAVLTKDAIVEAIQGLEDIVKWAAGEAGADRAVADLAGAAAGAATMLIGGPEARVGKLGCAAKTTAARLAGPGENLFVGTYGLSYRANVRAGLNATYTPHHSLQDAIRLTTHGRGITINLDKDLHALTRTFRTQVEEGLTLRQHLARDVVDLRQILLDAGYDRSVVNRQLQELIRQNKTLPGFPQ